MRVLIDSCIIIDALQSRVPFAEAAHGLCMAWTGMIRNAYVQLCTDLPLDLKSALPDPEEIRNRIDMKK